MTKGRALQALGPQWVGHRSWTNGSIGLHLAPSDEYCFQLVGTDFSSGTSVRSPESCSAPGEPTDEVFLELGELLNCDAPPDDESLRDRWCEHNPEHEVCGETTASGGSSGAGGSAGAMTTGGTGSGGGSGGSVGSPGGSGGSAGNPDSNESGGSGGSQAPTAEDPEARVSKGGCWCSVPRAPTGAHGASAFAALALLGLRRRTARA